MIDRSPEQDTAVIRSREVADERWTHLKDAVDNAGNVPEYEDACREHHEAQIGGAQSTRFDVPAAP